MPFHRIQRDDTVEAQIAAIEANGEEIATVFVEGAWYAVFTRRLGTLADTPTGVVFRPVEAIQAAGEILTAVVAP